MNRAPDWFAAVIARLMAAYPSWPCNGATIQAFWDALADLPRESLERAAVAHVARETAWPLAANIRRLAQDTSTERQKTPAEAWDEMYCHRHMHTRNPKWSSKAVEQAAVAVVWNSPDWLSEQIPTIRAQFERYYTSMTRKHVQTTEALDNQKLFELAVIKSAKDVYGDAYLRSESEEIRQLEHVHSRYDDVDPPQPDDVD